MVMAAIDDQPGFRRRFIVTPEPGRVRTDLEDDYHCMSVTVHHDGTVANLIEPAMTRVPWTTCPGAEVQLVQTFTGVALADFAARGEKKANCTHLHDLAVLAAAHATDDAPIVFDVLASDPVDGVRCAEVRRNGETLFAWSLRGFTILAPPEQAGMRLDDLQPWLETLDPKLREAARLLRWGARMANGRIIPMARQSDATKMLAGRCYTFQPDIAPKAIRFDNIREFSDGTAEPLAERIAVLNK
ncbi:Protein of unknown function [Sphingomonas sp. YR710]|nr:Protein of unknown function [Sphingomonas sp. YR710]